nr:hypothetical protein CFP56_25843 [Quercus suber]
MSRWKYHALGFNPQTKRLLRTSPVEPTPGSSGSVSFVFRAIPRPDASGPDRGRHCSCWEREVLQTGKGNPFDAGRGRQEQDFALGEGFRNKSTNARPRRCCIYGARWVGVMVKCGFPFDRHCSRQAGLIVLVPLSRHRALGWARNWKVLYLISCLDWLGTLGSNAESRRSDGGRMFLPGRSLMSRIAQAPHKPWYRLLDTAMEQRPQRAEFLDVDMANGRLVISTKVK